LDVREASLLRAIFIEVRKFLRRRGVIDDIGPVGRQRVVSATFKDSDPDPE